MPCAPDQVRRAEIRHEPNLKGSWWALLKRPAQWNPAQIATIHWLQRSGVKSTHGGRWKEALRASYRTATEPVLAEQLLRRGTRCARRSRRPAFKRLGA